jgi:hypothetical protein
VLILLGKLPVRAIIVDNAHLLDAKAIEWLLDLRTENDPHFATAPRRALIFAAQARPKEIEACPLAKCLTEIEEATAGWREQIVLNHLKGASFVEVLGKLFSENLQAEFSDDLDVDELSVELWKLTRGNWWSITRLAGLSAEELETLNKQSPRMITRAVVEGVRKRLAELPI